MRIVTVGFETEDNVKLSNDCGGLMTIDKTELRSGRDFSRALFLAISCGHIVVNVRDRDDLVFLTYVEGYNRGTYINQVEVSVVCEGDLEVPIDGSKVFKNIGQLSEYLTN